jgi:hypothetical protein
MIIVNLSDCLVRPLHAEALRPACSPLQPPATRIPSGFFQARMPPELSTLPTGQAKGAACLLLRPRPRVKCKMASRGRSIRLGDGTALVWTCEAGLSSIA